MKIRYLVALLLTVVLLVFARLMSTRHAEEFTVNAEGVVLSHKTVTENFGDGPVVTLNSSETDRERAEVRYSEHVGGPYQVVQMTPESGKFTARLPVLPKGEKWFYQIDIYRDNMKLATFPPEREQFIKFKGHISPLILVPHILLMFATIFFGLMAVFTSVDLSRGKGSAKRAVLFVLLTFISAFIGGIPLGIVVSQQTFGGSGWGGWPLGTDITDSKTEILLLCWVITLILSWGGLKDRKMLVSNGMFTFLTILSFVITFITFLIPHSI